ncbi:hypothetical protein FACS1894184_02550 [Clostridia bacterium]|nr:hypothetical protein FACS1894184_02550 [Clostridia bacterium]
MPTNRDREILRALAQTVSELASLPEMSDKRRMWRALNALKPERPMVMIDQVCWNEMNVDDELTNQCTDAQCQGYETTLRRIIYRYKHMSADYVVDGWIPVPMAITGANLGVAADEQTQITDPTSDVLSHKYSNQIQHIDDIYKVKMPVVGHDIKETERRLSFARDIFDGVIEVRPQGWDPYISVWDPITSWMGIENALVALMDEPDLIHALVDRVVAAYMSMLDQMVEKGLLTGPQSWIHCTGAWTDELPPSGYNPAQPRTKDIWAFGLAQMLGSVSPAMYNEFEIEPCKPMLNRFGLVYYGCCEPLDDRLNLVRKIGNVRKVSMSPWVKEARGAEAIGGEFVYSRKPNPALLGSPAFDETEVRRTLTATRDLCKQYKCPLEFIQKDISTVQYEPERLWRWSQIAMEVALG